MHGNLSTEEKELKNKQNYRWQPQPVNIWIAGQIQNRLQAHALEMLRLRLTDRGCVFINQHGSKTSIGSKIHLIINFSEGLESEIDSLKIRTCLSKPRGILLNITTVEKFPDSSKYEFARQQLVKKTCNLMIMVAGNFDTGSIDRIFWASIPGNYAVLKGEENTTFENLTLRILANACCTRANKKEKEISSVSWSEWADSPIHSEMSYLADTMGKQGLMSDEVNFNEYATNFHAKKLRKYVEATLVMVRLGEGYHSQIDLGLRIMGMSRTGGNKTKISANPMDGNVIPISKMTQAGYVISIPKGCPTHFGHPSEGTRECGMVFLASALVNAGIVRNFFEFVDYMESYFEEAEKIDIQPGNTIPGVTRIEHFHLQPRTDH